MLVTQSTKENYSIIFSTAFIKKSTKSFKQNRNNLITFESKKKNS